MALPEEKLNNSALPFQVQKIIDDMLSSKDNIYVRQNYRLRLDSMVVEINAAIKKFDNEMAFANNRKRR